MIKTLFVASVIVFSFSSVSFAKGKSHHRKDMRAFRQACKTENPKASKKDLKKCVRAKVTQARKSRS